MTFPLGPGGRGTRRPSQGVRALVVVTVVLLLGATGCSSAGSTGDKGYVTGNGTVVLLAPGERGDPVTLEGESLTGKPMSLASLRGSPVVVTVWGSWCAPCRAEAPDVVAVAKKLRGRAHVVGVNIRDPSVAQAKAFVRQFDVPFPSFYSPSGRALLAFDGKLTPRTIPAFVVLDAAGRVAATIIGPLPSRGTLLDLVDEVMEKGSGKGREAVSPDG